MPPSACPSCWCAPSALSLAPPPSPTLPLVRHPSPLPCPPPFRVPCWLHAESGGAMGGCKRCLHAAPHVAVPCCLVRAPPVGVPLQPSPLRLPLCPPPHSGPTPDPPQAPLPLPSPP